MAAIYRELSALADEGTDESAQRQEALALCEAEAELADAFDQSLAAHRRKERLRTPQRKRCLCPGIVCLRYDKRRSV